MIVLLAATLFAIASLTVDGAHCPSYPNQYIAYHLAPGQTIEIDGKLDDPAWLEVSRSSSFIDIQGSPPQPFPRFDTYFQMRYDDKWLYIGGYVADTAIWANQTKHDSVVFYDNDFEVFIDPDGSTHHYKEFEINARNTTWDLMLNKPYIDGGQANNSWDMYGIMSTATYIDGAFNNPNGAPDQYWSVELQLPHSYYVEQCFVATSPPQNGDRWRINFSRVEYRVQNVNGQWEKVPASANDPDNWVWQSQRTINMHLPERWGYVQFSTDPVNTTKTVDDPEWAQRAALAALYDSEHEFSAVNGYFTTDLQTLLTDYELPEWVMDGSCGTRVPNVTLPEVYSFTASIDSKDSSLETGHIQSDRLTWFGNVPPPGAITP